MEQIFIANIISLIVFSISLILLGLIKWIYQYRITCTKTNRSSFYLSLYQARLILTYFGLFSLSLLVTLYVLDQSTIRLARWIIYTVIHAFISYTIAFWYWRPLISSFAFLFVSILSSLSWSFFILTNNIIWFLIGSAYHLIWLFILIFHFKRNTRIDLCSIFIKLWIIVSWTLYPVIIILEHMISEHIITWCYLILDTSSVTLFIIIAALYYIPSPDDYCCNKEKCECQGACDCHNMEHGTHLHHYSNQHHHNSHYNPHAPIGTEIPSEHISKINIEKN